MFQTNTFNFRLSLARGSGNTSGSLGSYYIELTGESPFDVNKSFLERFSRNSAGTPFYSLEDAALFSEEMAGFWKLQLMDNQKLDITGIRELADIWAKFADNLCQSN